MCIRESGERLLTKIDHDENQLYMLNVNIAQPVFLVVRGEEAAWRWHTRLEHIGMSALRGMAHEELVRGLPSIEQVDQLCDACLAGKQKRNSFLSQTHW
jgi:hypothetical protein